MQMNSKKHLFHLLCTFWVFCAYGQDSVQGQVRFDENPVAFVMITTATDTIFTNMDGRFQVDAKTSSVKLKFQKAGFQTKTTEVHPATVGIIIELTRDETPNSAEALIKEVITNSSETDPFTAERDFQFKTYAKLTVKDGTPFSQIPSLNQALPSYETRFLAEKSSEFQFSESNIKEKITGFRTAGFEEPEAEILKHELEKIEIFQESYVILNTAYASPLSKKAFKNYDFQIIDSLENSVIVEFIPKRPKVVNSLYGYLEIDKNSMAVSSLHSEFSKKIKASFDIDLKKTSLGWVPNKHSIILSQGNGGEDIALFGSGVNIAIVQRRNGLLDKIFKRKPVQPGLFLESNVEFYDFETPVQDQDLHYRKELISSAENPGEEYWETNRKMPLTSADSLTPASVETLLKEIDYKRAMKFKRSIESGYYPLEFWDVDLSRIFKYNHYEGIRLGFGGKTSDQVSEKFNLNGYTTYGLKDNVQKYGFGLQYYLNETRTSKLNISHSRDIEEAARFKFLKGKNPFSVLEPRFVNINFFHNYRTTFIGLEQLIGKNLETELRLERTDIWQIRNYAFLKDGRSYSDYNLNMATFSFNWQPFSKYLHTPNKHMQIEKNFPQFTGQIQQAIKTGDGDFTFTRLGVKIDHEINRLDKSRTEFILEGNYLIGDAPLMHMFHAQPNNRNKPELLSRFSVAGRTSFETMYFNEFYSSRQAMFHMRHQLPPLRVTESIQPELVLISRHAIGDHDGDEDHIGVEFGSLKEGYNEVGMELNKLFLGFGLSAAYRYGYYHLPTFKENFSLKFTLQLQI